MKGWPEEIPDRSVAGLSIDGSHIKFDVWKTGRSLGMINMRHLYAIGARKNHLDTAGHKEGIIALKEQERQVASGDNITNDGKQQHLTLASLLTVKGTWSRFSWLVSKNKKRGRTETEISSRKSMEAVEVEVDAAESGDGTELWVPLIIYLLNNVTLSLEISKHLMLFIVDAGQHLVLEISTHTVGNLRIHLYSTQNIFKSKQGPSISLIHMLVCRPLFTFNVPSWGITFERKEVWTAYIAGIYACFRASVA